MNEKSQEIAELKADIVTLQERVAKLEADAKTKSQEFERELRELDRKVDSCGRASRAP